jgi:peptidoglycan/LPS O-acetylase OafA/YrhL
MKKRIAPIDGLRLCTLCRFFLFWDNRSDILNQLTIPSEQIWYRFVEFGFGVLAAIFYVDKKILPLIFRGLLGFVIALTIVYMGRLLMLKELLVLLGDYSYIPRAFGETVITFGFTIMLFNIIEYRTIFSKFISLDPFLFLGKISYNMYLWNWLISAYINKWLINYFGISNRTMMLAMVVTLAAVIPISWASYKIFEEFYFIRISKLRVIPKMQ